MHWCRPFLLTQELRSSAGSTENCFKVPHHSVTEYHIAKSSVMIAGMISVVHDKAFLVENSIFLLKQEKKSIQWERKCGGGGREMRNFLCLDGLQGRSPLSTVHKHHIS